MRKLNQRVFVEPGSSFVHQHASPNLESTVQAMVFGILAGVAKECECLYKPFLNRFLANIPLLGMSEVP